MGFLPIPPLPDIPEPLPAKVQILIDASVDRFEKRWENFGLIFINMARSQGWIEDYRREVTELVRKARGL